VEFWDDFAEIAAVHLNKDSYVFIAGSVWVETFLGKDGVERKLCKVSLVAFRKMVNRIEVAYSLIQFGMLLLCLISSHFFWSNNRKLIYIESRATWTKNKGCEIAVHSSLQSV
jgi:hypothetical protein